MHKLALLALGLAACTTTDSSDVLTSGIYAVITASTTGDGTTGVDATLYVGNPIGLNFVELTGDDSLVAIHTGSATSKTMFETELLNIVGHHAEFSVDAEGEEFEVVFDRTVDAGAPSSRMRLPAKFEIDAPPAAASRAQALTLSWSPAATPDVMSWEAEGDCIERHTSSINGDTGTVVIAPDTLKKRMGDMVADQCTVTVTIKRSKLGVLDPGYDSGYIAGVQLRTVTFTSTP